MKPDHRPATTAAVLVARRRASSIAPGIRATPRSRIIRTCSPATRAPERMELWVMNADGSNSTRSRTRRSNFAPFFTPGDRGSSSRRTTRIPEQEFRALSGDETDESRTVTNHPEFDGFPMFSPDGSKLVGRPAGRRKPGTQPFCGGLEMAYWHGCKTNLATDVLVARVPIFMLAAHNLSFCFLLLPVRSTGVGRRRPTAFDASPR